MIPASPLGSDPRSDQTFALATLLMQSRRACHASTRSSASNRHGIGKSPRPDRRSARPKFWQLRDTFPIVDPMFCAAGWCEADRAAMRRRRPACLDKNDRERVLIRRMSEAPCASRVADLAQFLGDDNCQCRHTSRPRSSLLRFETIPNHRVPRHRDGKEQTRHCLFGPKSGRNKKEESAKLRGRPRWNSALAGRNCWSAPH